MVSCPKFGTLYTMNAILNSTKYGNRAYNMAQTVGTSHTCTVGAVTSGSSIECYIGLTCSPVPPRTPLAHT